MAPVVISRKDRRAGPGDGTIGGLEEGRLDPGLGRLTDCAAPPAIPPFIALGFPICFTVALGILLLGAHTIEAICFLALGGLGLLIVRYLNRHS